MAFVTKFSVTFSRNHAFLHTGKSHSVRIIKTRFISNVSPISGCLIISLREGNGIRMTTQYSVCCIAHALRLLARKVVFRIAAHICNYGLRLTFRSHIAVTLETAIPIKPYLAATIDWNLICQIRNDHHRNRKQLQNLNPLCLNQTAIERTYANKRIVLLKKISYTLSKNNCHCYDERTNFKGVKNLAVNFKFRWQRAPRLKVLWIARRRYTSSFDWKCLRG